MRCTSNVTARESLTFKSFWPVTVFSDNLLSITYYFHRHPGNKSKQFLIYLFRKEFSHDE